MEEIKKIELFDQTLKRKGINGNIIKRFAQEYKISVDELIENSSFNFSEAFLNEELNIASKKVTKKVVKK